MHKPTETKALVRVKEKYQVTLPAEMRAKARLAVGDLLEIGIERSGVITLTPKSLVDRHVAEGLADLKAGRVHGPYKSADEAIAELDQKAARKKTAR